MRKVFLIGIAIIVISASGYPAAQDEITWAKSLVSALNEAKKFNKCVLLDIRRPWSIWAKSESYKVYGSRKMLAQADDFVFVRINVSKNKKYKDRGVADILDTVTGYPTIIILDPLGKEVERFVGILTSGDFISRIEAARDKLEVRFPRRK